MMFSQLGVMNFAPTAPTCFSKIFQICGQTSKSAVQCTWSCPSFNTRWYSAIMQQVFPFMTVCRSVHHTRTLCRNQLTYQNILYANFIPSLFVKAKFPLVTLKW